MIFSAPGRALFKTVSTQPHKSLYPKVQINSLEIGTKVVQERDQLLFI